MYTQKVMQFNCLLTREFQSIFDLCSKIDVPMNQAYEFLESIEDNDDFERDHAEDEIGEPYLLLRLAAEEDNYYF